MDNTVLYVSAEAQTAYDALDGRRHGGRSPHGRAIHLLREVQDKRYRLRAHKLWMKGAALLHKPAVIVGIDLRHYYDPTLKVQELRREAEGLGPTEVEDILARAASYLSKADRHLHQEASVDQALIAGLMMAYAVEVVKEAGFAIA